MTCARRGSSPSRPRPPRSFPPPRPAPPASARIGEGLIYDMRSRVFAHVQRMPLAFFTRTQTGALVSRLNGDVLGAQQAFTTTLSGIVSNVVGLVLTAGVMFSLSWQITAIALVMLPLFVVPARRIGARLQGI